MRTHTAPQRDRLAVEGPWDDEAEKAVLGACLLDDALVHEVAPLLSPEDFHRPAHSVIFTAMQAVVERSVPLDVTTLLNELRSMERANAVGGAQYLGELTDSIPTTAHTMAHARLVAEHARARRLLRAGLEIAEKAGHTYRDVGRLALEAEEAVRRAGEGREEGGPVLIHHAVMEVFGELEAAGEAGRQTTGIPTGFVKLDDMTAGLHAGEVTLVAARPACGKSSFGLDVARHVAEGELRASREGGTTPRAVVFFSLEMPRGELVRRALCSEARLDLALLRKGQITHDDMTRLMTAGQRIAELPLFIDDRTSTTFTSMRGALHRLARQHAPVCLVVIDYGQLMDVGDDKRRESHEREMSALSRSLKLLAKDVLRAPVIVLCQLNRSPEQRGNNHRPQLADIRASGSWEQDADNVLLLYRDELYNPESDDRGIAEVIVAKQRNGPTGTVRLRFIRELTRFENLEEDREPPPPPSREEDVDAF